MKSVILYLGLEFKKEVMNMENVPACPQCGSTYTYDDGTGLITCPECGYEFHLDELAAAEAAAQIKDSVGNILTDGDTVTVIKDLPVKGMPKPIKKGTKVKNIRLVDPDMNNGHDIDAKVDGFGNMGLKSSVVKKG
jgi:protein PhnA